MGSFLRCQITFLEWRLDYDKSPCHERLVIGQSACKKKMQLIPPSGLYLGTQSGMTQFIEWIEGPEDSEKEDWGFKTRPSLLEWDRWWAA